MKGYRIHHHRYQRPCLLWVPRPVSTPRHVSPHRTQEYADGKEEHGRIEKQSREGCGFLHGNHLPSMQLPHGLQPHEHLQGKQGVGTHHRHHMDRQQRRLQHRHQLRNLRCSARKHCHQKAQRCHQSSEALHDAEPMLHHRCHHKHCPCHELHDLVTVAHRHMPSNPPAQGKQQGKISQEQPYETRGDYPEPPLANHRQAKEKHDAEKKAQRERQEHHPAHTVDAVIEYLRSCDPLIGQQVAYHVMLEQLYLGYYLKGTPLLSRNYAFRKVIHRLLYEELLPQGPLLRQHLTARAVPRHSPAPQIVRKHLEHLTLIEHGDDIVLLICLHQSFAVASILARTHILQRFLQLISSIPVYEVAERSPLSFNAEDVLHLLALNADNLLPFPGRVVNHPAHENLISRIALP